MVNDKVEMYPVTHKRDLLFPYPSLTGQEKAAWQGCSAQDYWVMRDIEDKTTVGWYLKIC